MHGKLWPLLLCATLLAACGAPAPVTPAAGELTDVNLCYAAPTVTQSVPWYALENGIFEKYGLRINLFMVQGSSQAVTVLIAGDADLCQAAGNAVVNAAAAGQDVVMIAGIYNTYPAVLVARPEIKSPQDLRGRKVGTGLAGSASYVATHLALEELGLDADSDVLIIEIGEVRDRMAAFRAGQIDAALVDPPYLHSLREDGVSELLDFGRSSIPYSHTSILTTRRFIAQDRDAAINFMKAILEAIARMKQDPDGAKAVMAKYMGLDPVADAADLTDAYENVVLPMLQDIPYPNLAGLQTVIDFTAVTNPDAAGLKPASLVDQSLIKELEDSGFIAQLPRQ